MTKLKAKLSDLKKVIPAPQGYRILIAMPPEKNTSSGGIIIPDELKGREATASIVGTVIAMGPDAYKDKAKFPTGAWCKEGDWVIFRAYSGTKFRIDKQEFRLLNDDSVEATVYDPRMIERA